MRVTVEDVNHYCCTPCRRGKGEIAPGKSKTASGRGKVAIAHLYLWEQFEETRLLIHAVQYNTQDRRLTCNADAPLLLHWVRQRREAEPGKVTEVGRQLDEMPLVVPMLRSLELSSVNCGRNSCI